jgi:cold shock CspA family protein
MVDDLLYGRVTSFRREQGFGVITLDDGRDIKFDASDCTMVPSEGDAVQLRVGPARWGGGLKALQVEEAPARGAAPRASSTLAVPPATLEQQIAALQREHLVSGLSEHVMAQLVRDAFGGQIGDASLAEVLDAYYGADPRRARNDRYVRFTTTRRYAVSDVLADLAAVLPALPEVVLPRAVPLRRARAVGDGGQEPSDAIGALVIPGFSDEPHEVCSIDDIVGYVNYALQGCEGLWLLWPLKTTGAWCAYLALDDERAARLMNVL